MKRWQMAWIATNVWFLAGIGFENKVMLCMAAICLAVTVAAQSGFITWEDER